MKKQDLFWMVSGEIYNNNPSVRHESEESAKNEAERLAIKHPGRRFYVLQSVSVCILGEVRHEPIYDLRIKSFGERSGAV